ncbi:MAG: S8 family serine peptidase [Chitinophagaceae bacterium]|nr:S8 family serine peptidase [Chitinophagaceae bacterium]
MKSKLVIFVVLLLECLNSAAQENPGYQKFSAALKLFLAEMPPASRFYSDVNGEKRIAVIIEFEKGSDEDLLKKSGISIRTILGDIATADIVLDKLNDIASLNEIKRIELPLLFVRTDTSMRKFTTVDKVLRGDVPLDKAYSGKNVVIGIIDDGIDITHPDFYDSTGNLKVVSLWNMDRNGVPPTGFGYGTEWSRDTMKYFKNQYKQGSFTNRDMENLLGFCFHGTPVAGLAAGNNGVAPGAEIVGVALTALVDTLLRSDRILDAIKYIYSKAASQGKKCVINMSLGVMDGGPHDGKTLVERAIDNFCDEHPDDLLVCTSAGNNGNTWKHWGGFPIHRDSSYCFFFSSYTASLYFSIPKQFSNSLALSFTDSKPSYIFANNILPDNILGQTPFYNITSLINNGQPVSYRTYLQNGSLSSTFTIAASHYNNDYDEVVVKVREHTSNGSNFDHHLYRFIWKGQGSVHAWFPFLNLHPRFIQGQNPLPNDSTFRLSDNEFTTVIPTHAFSVLSSGAYNIRSCYVNKKNHVVDQYSKCRTTYFTSHGPTLDGRIKPDVLTPGENVIAPRKRFDNFFDFEFILDSSRLMFGGTSASSPITAGIAALVWEKFPGISRQEMITRIKSSTYFDSWCSTWGNQPNNVAGWGKADAFKALTGFSSDPETYCTPADVCIAPPPPPPPPVIDDQIKVYPNPASDIVFIEYISNTPIEAHVYDSYGRLAQQASLPARTIRSASVLDVAKLSSGVYFIKLEGMSVKMVRKIVISH